MANKNRKAGTRKTNCDKSISMAAVTGFLQGETLRASQPDPGMSGHEWAREWGCTDIYARYILGRLVTAKGATKGKAIKNTPAGPRRVTVWDIKNLAP